MKYLEKLLDEQKHNCQTEFDKRSELIDGIWYVACEDVLNAPYPKQMRLRGVSNRRELLIAELVKAKSLTEHLTTEERNEYFDLVISNL